MARRTSKKRPRNPAEKSDYKTSGAWYVTGDRGQQIYIVNPGDWHWNVVGGYRPHHRGGGLWLFQFGAYGATWVAVWNASLEDALEEAGGWLADHAPGHLTTEEELWKDKGLIEDAMEDVGVSGPFNELDEEDQYKVHESMTTDMTYTESGYLNSWEWYVNELDPGDPDYKKILVESAREDPEVIEEDEGTMELYQKALAATRSSKRRTNMSGQDYAKKSRRGKRSNPKRARSRKKAVSGRKRNPKTAAAKRRAMRG